MNDLSFTLELSKIISKNKKLFQNLSFGEKIGKALQIYKLQEKKEKVTGHPLTSIFK